MRRFSVIVMLSIVSMMITSCSNITNQDVGTVAGGALGGILGNQIGGGNGRIVATIGGTLLGAFVGNRIGQSMDQVDQMRMEQAIQNNQAATWTNQKTNTRYSVVPQKTYSNNCRSYNMYVYMGGSKKRVHGCSCLRNGNWVTASARMCGL